LRHKFRKNHGIIMYLPLETLDVWEFQGVTDAPRFFAGVHKICAETDIIVLGSYDPGPAPGRWLAAHELASFGGARPFSDSFDLNRREYPLGRSYTFRPSDDLLLGMSALASSDSGSVDGRKLFVDHVLIYRTGEPLLPLLNFHDAFTGGRLYMSGHYTAKVVQDFGSWLGVTARLVPNPDGATVSPYVGSDQP
jgi:hypothetical protein